MAFIEVDGIDREYSDGFRLRDISFDLEKGEILTLMGPSGSGKTSILRNICGLDRPDAGRIMVDGSEITNLPVSRRRIGMIFQDLALFPHMSVYDNIAYGLRSIKVPERETKGKVEDIAEILGIGGLLHRYPSQISGGERQRVALARSVVPDPLLLLLDEPLSSLDAPLRGSVRAEIKSFARKTGLTMIYVTHDHHEGFYMADRAGIILNGSIRALGNPRDIFENPGTETIASFLGYNILTFENSRIAVHPGQIYMSDESPDVTGTVESSGFEGDLYRISVVLEDGTKIQAWLSPTSDSKTYQQKRKIGLKFRNTVKLDAS